jgi:hypothetical protein
MAGLSDFAAERQLNDSSGAIVTVPAGATANYTRFLALFSTAPTSDAGTGGTEISGGSYARVQFAGELALNASFTTSSTTLTLASTAPAWLLALGTGAGGNGVNVYDLTVAGGVQIGTVTSISGTTVTLTTTAAHASSGAADNILFSAFPLASASSGSEPATTPANVTNGSQINFAQSTGAWSNVTSFGIYDASSSGNLYYWDYTGNGKWSEFTCTSATPGVLTVTDQSFTNGNSVVVSTKVGGTLPTTGGSWAGLLTVAGVSGSTFNVGVNTTGTGNGMIRPVITYSVGTATTFTVPSSSFVLSAA